MFRRKLIPTWIGIILLSGMFLMGQESWPPPCDDVVHFPDPYLEEAIRDAIEKPTGDICASDLEGLIYLNAGGSYDPIQAIVTLVGLEYCTDLTELHLSINFITNIGRLAGLTNLTHLYLDNNLIWNIAPLAGLTNLTHLYLRDNLIWNITPLAGLTNLTHLSLSGNSVSNISPLAALTNLERLGVDYNKISNIYPLIRNFGIDSRDVVWLLRNPLSWTSCTFYIPELQNRGVHVTYDPLDDCPY